MTTQNLTDWFNLYEQKPWEPGVYQVKVDGEISDLDTNSFWNGAHFCLCGSTIKRASLPAAIEEKTARNITHWRGLSSDPNAKPATTPKPKARGNRKVTRYVVMREGAHWNVPIAVFEDEKIANEYKDRENKKHGDLLYVESIRFRTPEAD